MNNLLMAELGETVAIQTQADSFGASTIVKLREIYEYGVLVESDVRKIFYTWGFIRKIEQHSASSPDYVNKEEKRLGERAVDPETDTWHEINSCGIKGTMLNDIAKAVPPFQVRQQKLSQADVATLEANGVHVGSQSDEQSSVERATVGDYIKMKPSVPFLWEVDESYPVTEVDEYAVWMYNPEKGNTDCIPHGWYSVRAKVGDVVRINLGVTFCVEAADESFVSSTSDRGKLGFYARHGEYTIVHRATDELKYEAEPEPPTTELVDVLENLQGIERLRVGDDDTVTITFVNYEQGVAKVPVKYPATILIISGGDEK